MAPTTTCTGCKKLFSNSGYWSHLTQTTNPICKAILREQLGVSPEDFVPVEHHEERSGPMAFTGDAFGSADDYMDDDFGQGDDVAERPVQEPEQPDLDVGDDNPAVLDEEDTEQRMREYELEAGWEADRPQQQDIVEDEMDDDEAGVGFDARHRLAAEARMDGCSPRIVRYSTRFPSSFVGAIRSTQITQDNRYSSALGSSGLWAPFASEMDWRVARWAKLRGPGSTAFSELLSINGVCEALKLSYRNTEELNKIIDNHLPSRPRFKRYEVVVAGEAFELFARDIVECLKALWGDPEFLPFLVFEPEEHYADDKHSIRLFHDMHTGKWWWSTQRRVELKTKKSGITIVPIIISSDKTQVTVFRNKLAYPVYLTIGNLPKHIRRKPSRQGQVLLAYPPTTKLSHITNKAARRRAVANLFHACMGFLVKPLETLGLTGLHMASGDGAIRDCHPILAAYCGDYPEQILVTCTKSGECPTCPAATDQLGDPESVTAPRELEPILRALNTIKEDPTEFTQACKTAGIKPIQHPFWQRLPFVNIFRSITPDILHQLYQGNIKHLIGWLKQACGEAEIDARCRRLPPNHNIRLFLKGISHLNRVTGAEHDQICRFLLAIIIDVRIPSIGRSGSARLVRAVRGLLDFLYLAKFPVHSTETLDRLAAALSLYQANRQIFIDLGIRNDFNFPKDHFLNHYRELIELFGTTDNFNTEYTERLHIDLAKDPYRSTNSKDEYSQMTAWVDRREKVLMHEKYMARRLQNTSSALIIRRPHRIPPLVNHREMKIAQSPSARGVTIDDIILKYGATDFKGALARFVVHRHHPEFSRRQVEEAASTLYIPFCKMSVFHRIKFTSQDPFSIEMEANTVVDSIHCEPACTDKYGNQVPGRFDTAVIKIENGGRAGIRDYCVGQIRCVFSLPASAQKVWFPHGDPPPHLAYVDWFTPFSDLRPGRDHGLYKISRRVIDGRQRSSVIPVTLIHQSAHLVPAFGPVAPPEWRSSTVLDSAPHFYVNSFSDRYAYSRIY